MDALFRRRRLPHLDVEGATYFVTACLAGSIPAVGLKELDRYRRELESLKKPVGRSERDWRLHKHKLLFARVDEWLDGMPAVRHFQNNDIAKVVRDGLFHFAGERYHQIAYCIMPSHIHWVFQPTRKWCDELAEKEKERQRQARCLPHRKSGAGILPAAPPAKANRAPKSPREVIMQSLKSYTALRCNTILGHSGAFWQDESYDHVVRDDDELLRIIHYVEQNPVKAMLAKTAEEWQWSSATERVRSGTVIGQPLVKKDRKE